MMTKNHNIDYQALAKEAEETTFNLNELEPATAEDNERHFRAFIIDRLEEINAKLDKLALAS
ncbi:hypothetical protein FACS1894104_0820 [Actinomycetota bacterium]|nr:hypothetical protein FACS1894104_0820 [Actinomycetota bacterium]